MKIGFSLICLVLIFGSSLAVENEEQLCFGNLNMTATEGQLIGKVKEIINSNEEISIEYSKKKKY